MNSETARRRDRNERRDGNGCKETPHTHMHTHTHTRYTHARSKAERRPDQTLREGERERQREGNVATQVVLVLSVVGFNSAGWPVKLWNVSSHNPAGGGL